MFAAVLCALWAAVQGSYAASVIGVVTESSQATIDGAPALRGQTVMAGARVQVADGAAIVMLSGTTRRRMHDRDYAPAPPSSRTSSPVNALASPNSISVLSR